MRALRQNMKDKSQLRRILSCHENKDLPVCHICEWPCNWGVDINKNIVSVRDNPHAKAFCASCSKFVK